MKKEKRRVIIDYDSEGLPVYRFISANSQDEMNIKIVKVFIDSGRINELLPPLYQIPPHVDVRMKEYAYEWLNRKRKLKETTRINYKTYIDNYIIPSLGKNELLKLLLPMFR